MYVGRLDRAKRIDLLIRALARTNHGRVIIAGTGAEESGLRRLAHAQGVEARVEFTGFVEEARLLELYANARAVVYAPVDEDYGFAAVEALMAARPVITTDDAGGVLEFVADGESGWVTHADENEIAAALARAFEDAATCRARGERGRERVQEITWDRVVEGLTR